MDNFTLYRKRLIPFENIKLSNDVILFSSKDKIITSWKTIRPRTDMDHGFSLYLPAEGIKISKFLKSDGSLYKWYCDIVDYSFNEEDNSVTALDLLLDVTISPDGRVKVLDLDELASAHKSGLIDDALMEASLIRTNRLLDTIYSGGFKKYENMLDEYIG